MIPTYTLTLTLNLDTGTYSYMSVHCTRISRVTRAKWQYAYSCTEVDRKKKHISDFDQTRLGD